MTELDRSIIHLVGQIEIFRAVDEMHGKARRHKQRLIDFKKRKAQHDGRFDIIPTEVVGIGLGHKRVVHEQFLKHAIARAGGQLRLSLRGDAILARRHHVDRNVGDFHDFVVGNNQIEIDLVRFGRPMIVQCLGLMGNPFGHDGPPPILLRLGG